MNALLLIPQTQFFQLDHLNLTVREIGLELTSNRSQAKCLDCGMVSFRIHSSHSRTVADLPWAGRRVVLHLHLHRFFCDNPACPRRTFVERLPDFAAPYARRTQRLAETLCQIGLVLGGEAGTRMIQKQGMPTSADTLLRLVRNSSDPEFSPPRVLGVDDWAWQKGKTYGTILVDHERHCIIDLLPNRSADTLAKWLRQYPGIELVTRDRSTGYLDGISEGAPQATQIADRWHLLKNLSETLEKVLNRHQHDLRLTSRSVSPSLETIQTPEPTSSACPRPLTRYEQQRQAIQAKRQAQFTEVRELHEQGVGIREISRRLRIGRGKVQRLIRSDGFPMNYREKKVSILDDYWAYIEQRWTEGCRNGLALYQELQQQGFSGCYGTLSRKLISLRQAMPCQTPQRGRPSKPAEKPDSSPRITPRQAVWLLLKPPEEMDGDQKAYLDRLFDRAGELRQSYELAQTFSWMVRERAPSGLDEWLQLAWASGITEFRNFSASLQRDQKAVQAGMTYAWSNGPTEGHNNRLKLIKREMYGRANFDLLRRRVLYAG